MSILSLEWMILLGVNAKPLVDICISLGSLLIYFPQYIKIYETSNANGFSLITPLILISSNILRVCFWFVSDISLPFLFQSFATILMQILILELSVRVRSKSSDSPRHLSDMKISDFWNWTDLKSYLIVIVIFTIFSSLIVNTCSDNIAFMQLIGFIALGIESLLPFPQLIRNINRQSVEGVSLLMICCWIFSDFLKVGYLTLNKVPVPFFFCGIIQAFTEILIVIQFFYWSNDSNNNQYKELFLIQESCEDLDKPAGSLSYDKLDALDDPNTQILPNLVLVPLYVPHHNQDDPPRPQIIDV